MSDGGNIPSTGRELVRNLQKRVSMAERSLSVKASSERVETLDKYVDQLLAYMDAYPDADVSPTPDTVAQRDGAGALYTAPGTDGEHAVNLNQLNAASAASEAYADSAVSSALPAGVVQMWGGDVGAIPDGWLRCVGDEVSRTTYADLFAAIGTTYGAGDGSTTFNLPNFAQASPVGAFGLAAFAPGATGGAANHTHTTPNHNHGLSTGWARWATERANDWAAWAVKAGITQWTGSYRTGSGAVTDTTTSTTYTEGLSLGGNTESDGAGNTGSGDSYHPYLAVSFIIKT